jgi:hypothetical protein
MEKFMSWNWWNDLFDSDYQQRRDLLKQEDEIRSIESSLDARSNDLKVRIEKLETQNDELKLVCVALLHTLIERDLITKDSFIQLAQQIDAADGRQNGRYEGTILPQPEPPSKREIKIDFRAAREKPESFNS